MSKIELPTVTGSNNISLINDNFQKIEDALNKEVLYRKGYTGEPNEMQTNIDLNGKKILNVTTGTGSGDLATRGYIDQQLSGKYDKTGGPISGDVQLSGYKITGIGEVVASKTSTALLEINGVPVIPSSVVIDPSNGVRESLRKIYTDEGYPPVAGSFELGGTINNLTDSLLYEATGKCYSWGGVTFPKIVPPGSTPGSSGGVTPNTWIDRSPLTPRKKIVILATGQSNVQQEMPFTWTPPANVFVWEWPGRSFTGIKFGPCPSTRINHTYACAAELARLNPSLDVYVVKIASGGRPIDHWLPGGSAATLPAWDAYADCKTNTEAALAVLGVNKVDYLHWHQGENDINNQVPYVSKWEQMYARFASETWFSNTTRAIVNGVTSASLIGVPAYEGINMKLRKVVASSPSLRTFIPTSEIITEELWQTDKLHITADGHLALGIAEAQSMHFGGTMPIPQGYMYDPETKTACIGGGEPTLGGGILEVNRGVDSNGSSYNAQTSLNVINKQGGSSDTVAIKVVGLNGTYSITSYSQGALANTARVEWTGTSQMQHAVSTGGVYAYYAGSTELIRLQDTLMRPGLDANLNLGTASFRYKTIYLENAPVVSSDERMKTPPEAIYDDVLDAWSLVDFYTFRMLSDVEHQKDKALIRCGVIAQRIVNSFTSKGLNALHYGLLRHDQLETDGGVEGECRYGVVYEEALVLEAALQRRNYQRLLARIEALEVANG